MKTAANERKKALHYEVDHFFHLLFMLQTYAHGHLVMVHSRAREWRLMYLCNVLPAANTDARSEESVGRNGHRGLFLVGIFLHFFYCKHRGVIENPCSRVMCKPRPSLNIVQSKTCLHVDI